MNQRTVPADFDLPLANFGINAGLCLAGVLAGVCVVLLARKVIRRVNSEGVPHLLVVIDAILVVVGTILTSALELWRLQTLSSLGVYSASGYAVLGTVIAVGIGSKWLLSVSREQNAARFKALENAAAAASRERDILLSLEVLIQEVMKAKIARLAHRRRTGNGSWEEALAPRKQIHLIIQVLHGHFSKRLAAGRRLRIGIYQLREDGTTLGASYSWDGARTDCFSNKHLDYMRITNPGGARSVVVECWQAHEPFRFVADGEAESRAGRFNYFYPGQEKELRSMAAYRHNLSGLAPEDAFVMAFDSDQAGFFAVDAQEECRLILPAFCRRLELELLALSSNQ